MIPRLWLAISEGGPAAGRVWQTTPRGWGVAGGGTEVHHDHFPLEVVEAQASTVEEGQGEGGGRPSHERGGDRAGIGPEPVGEKDQERHHREGDRPLAPAPNSLGGGLRPPSDASPPRGARGQPA